MKRDFSNDELWAAMDVIARNKCPKWMNAIEKQAYALGIITDEHVVKHNRCNGRGWLPSSSPYSEASCSCPDSTGDVISDQGKALIKDQFPGYKITED